MPLSFLFFIIRSSQIENIISGGIQERELSKWLLKGSAVCTNTSWEPCPTCDFKNSNEFRVGRGRSINDDNFELLFIKKNNCSVHDTFGAMSLIILLLVTLAVYYFFFPQRMRAGAFDDAEERSSDYSIIVKNPPKRVIKLEMRVINSFFDSKSIEKP